MPHHQKRYLRIPKCLLSIWDRTYHQNPKIIEKIITPKLLEEDSINGAHNDSTLQKPLEISEGIEDSRQDNKFQRIPPLDVKMDNLQLFRHLLAAKVVEQVEIAAASDDYSQVLVGENRFLGILINEDPYAIEL